MLAFHIPPVSQVLASVAAADGLDGLGADCVLIFDKMYIDTGGIVCRVPEWTFASQPF